MHSNPTADPIAQDAPPGWEDRTLTVPEVISVLGRLIVPVTVVMIGVHFALWGWPSASAGTWVSGILWLLAAYLVGVVVHELLHIIPMLLAGVRWSEIQMGVRLSEGVVFVHAGRPLPARAYRIVLAVPGIALGVVPWIVGLVTGSLFLTGFGYLMLISAVGDWAIIRLIRDLGSEVLVQDHPSAVGCLVPSDRNAD